MEDRPKSGRQLGKTQVSARVPGDSVPPAGARSRIGLFAAAVVLLLAAAAWRQITAKPRRPGLVSVGWEGPRLTLRALPVPGLELDLVDAAGRRPLLLQEGWLSVSLEPAPGVLRLVSRPEGVLDLVLPRVTIPAFPDDVLDYTIDLPVAATGSWSCLFAADRQESRRVDGVTEGTKVRFPWMPPRSARAVGVASLEGAYPVPGEPALTVSVQARLDRQIPTLSWLQEDLLESLDPKTRGHASVLTPEAVKKLLARAHGLPEGAEAADWSALDALYRARLANPASRDPSRLEWLQWTWLLEILARAHVVEPPLHALEILAPHVTLELEPIGKTALRDDFAPVGMYFMEQPDSAISDISFQMAMGAFGTEPTLPDAPGRPRWIFDLKQMEAWRSEQELTPLFDGDVKRADPIGIRLTVWHFFRRQPYVLSFETVGTARTRRLLVGNEHDRGHHGNPHQALPNPGQPASWQNLPVTGSRVELVVPRAYVGEELPGKIHVKMLDLPDPRRDSKYATILGVEWFDPGAR